MDGMWGNHKPEIMFLVEKTVVSPPNAVHSPYAQKIRVHLVDS